MTRFPAAMPDRAPSRGRATPQPGVAIEKMEAGIDQVIAKLLEDGVTEEEVRRAKNALIADVTYARDNVSTAARILGTARATGGTVERVESWPEKIVGVTPEQVHDAALSVLRPSQSTTGKLLPKPAS